MIFKSGFLGQFFGPPPSLSPFNNIVIGVWRRSKAQMDLDCEQVQERKKVIQIKERLYEHHIKLEIKWNISVLEQQIYICNTHLCVF